MLIPVLPPFLLILLTIPLHYYVPIFMFCFGTLIGYLSDKDYKKIYELALSAIAEFIIIPALPLLYISLEFELSFTSLSLRYAFVGCVGMIGLIFGRYIKK
jgi:uncharacterized membrane protein YoaK (UPF0700 family)